MFILKSVFRMHLGNPVMRSYYKNGFAKHYVRDHDVLRFEAATNNVSQDYNIPKAVENLGALREKMQGITNRYQDVQQDILETFLDRGELKKPTETTVLPNGKDSSSIILGSCSNEFSGALLPCGRRGYVHHRRIASGSSRSPRHHRRRVCSRCAPL